MTGMDPAFRSQAWASGVRGQAQQLNFAGMARLGQGLVQGQQIMEQQRQARERGQLALREMRMREMNGAVERETRVLQNAEIRNRLDLMQHLDAAEMAKEQTRSAKLANDLRAMQVRELEQKTDPEWQQKQAIYRFAGQLDDIDTILDTGYERDPRTGGVRELTDERRKFYEKRRDRGSVLDILDKTIDFARRNYGQDKANEVWDIREKLRDGDLTESQARDALDTLGIDAPESPNRDLQDAWLNLQRVQRVTGDIMFRRRKDQDFWLRQQEFWQGRIDALQGGLQGSRAPQAVQGGPGDFDPNHAPPDAPGAPLVTTPVQQPGMTFESSDPWTPDIDQDLRGAPGGSSAGQVGMTPEAAIESMGQFVGMIEQAPFWSEKGSVWADYAEDPKLKTAMSEAIAVMAASMARSRGIRPDMAHVYVTEGAKQEPAILALLLKTAGSTKGGELADDDLRAILKFRFPSASDAGIANVIKFANQEMERWGQSVQAATEGQGR